MGAPHRPSEALVLFAVAPYTRLVQRPSYGYLFLLAFGLIIRCYDLTGPLVDTHSWRQTQTAMLARNLYRNHFNILLPEIDWAADTSGYMESEFQLYTLVVALGYALFGVQEWVGRLVAALCFMGAAWFFWLFCQRYQSPEGALLSLLFLLVSPLGLFFSRAFMPESAMLFFMMGGFYLFLRLLEEERPLYLFGAFFFLACMLLVKVPTLFMAVPLAGAVALHHGPRALFSVRMIAFGLLVLLPPLLWYAYGYQLGQRTGLTIDIWRVGQDKWGSLAVWTNADFYAQLLLRLLFHLLTPPVALAALIGLCLPAQGTGEKLSFYFLGGVVLYCFVVAKGNWVHNYYQTPFLFPLSYFAGRGLESILSLWQQKGGGYACFVSGFLALLTFFVWQPLPQFYRKQVHFLQAAEMVRRHVPEGAPILTVDDSLPEVLYYADRRGWHLHAMEQPPERMNEFRAKGARAVVLARRPHQVFPEWEGALANLPCPVWSRPVILCYMDSRR